MQIEISKAVLNAALFLMAMHETITYNYSPTIMQIIIIKNVSIPKHQIWCSWYFVSLILWADINS